MLPYFSAAYGNAGGVYDAGRTARRALEDARRIMAEALNCLPQEIYFTSGGTESDNWAVKGTAFANRERGRQIITSAIEHPAVLNACRWMEEQGFNVSYLPVNEYGQVKSEDVERSVTDQTVLISVMMANNEIGTLQPVREIAAIAKERGIPFHTDAVQAVGAIPVDVQEIGCDMLSLSAHKFHGPKGVGALYIRKGTRIDNLLHGGAQERGRRASTENIPAIVGMAEALRISAESIQETSSRISALRDDLIRGLLSAVPCARLNGHPTLRLPNNCNLSFRFVEGSTLTLRLDLAGIDASSGSACASGSPEPSHVLQAIGLSPEDARGSLRLTLGDTTTREEIERVIQILPGIVQSLRDYSPDYKAYIENASPNS